MMLDIWWDRFFGSEDGTHERTGSVGSAPTSIGYRTELAGTETTLKLAMPVGTFCNCDIDFGLRWQRILGMEILYYLPACCDV